MQPPESSGPYIVWKDKCDERSLKRRCAIQSQPSVEIRREISTSSSKAILLLLTRGHTASTQRTNQGLFFFSIFLQLSTALHSFGFTHFEQLLRGDLGGGVHTSWFTPKSLMVLLRLDRESFFSNASHRFQDFRKHNQKLL